MLGDRRLWVIVLIAFTCTGLVASSRHFTWDAPVFDDREASLRKIATQHLAEADGLEQLRATLESLPPNDPVVFFGSSASWGATEIYLLTSYLYWPHDVWFVHTGEGLTAPAPPAPPEWVKGNSSLFFFEIEPPPEIAPNVRRIGPHLSVIPSRRSSPQQ